VSTETGVSVDGVVDGLTGHGYALVPRATDPARLEAARGESERILAGAPTGRDDFEGRRTRRVYGLFAKTRAFDAVAVDPLVLGVLDRVLGHYQLGAPALIDIGPGERAQPLHRDDALYPVTRPHAELVVSAMWPLDDFTPQNGATRIVPGSHDDLADSPADFDRASLPVVMPAGSVLLYLGSTLHGGGANRSERSRRGVVMHYSASWLRAVENHVLAVPRPVVRTLAPRLQELLGYNVHPPFVGYVDGRHPRRVLG